LEFLILVHCEGGIISYGENEFGLSPGLYFEMYQKLLNPQNNRLFQPPKYGKAFQKTIHKGACKTYFVNKKVGYQFIGEMMPKVNRIPLVLLLG
jgi:hypothetical protein